MPSLFDILSVTATVWGAVQTWRLRRAKAALQEAQAARVDAGLADHGSGSRIGREAREAWDEEQRALRLRGKK